MNQQVHPDSDYTQADHRRMMNIVGVAAVDREDTTVVESKEIKGKDLAHLMCSGLIESESRHNGSPTARYFMDFLTSISTEHTRYPPYRLEGYIVPPTRADCGVTITGINTRRNLESEEKERFKNWFLPTGDADYYESPKGTWHPNSEPDEWSYDDQPRAWWD